MWSSIQSPTQFSPHLLSCQLTRWVHLCSCRCAARPSQTHTRHYTAHTHRSEPFFYRSSSWSATVRCSRIQQMFDCCVTAAGFTVFAVWLLPLLMQGFSPGFHHTWVWANIQLELFPCAAEACSSAVCCYMTCLCIGVRRFNVADELISCFLLLPVCCFNDQAVKVASLLLLMGWIVFGDVFPWWCWHFRGGSCWLIVNRVSSRVLESLFPLLPGFMEMIKDMKSHL